jgi:beta-lactamase class D
MLVEPSGVVMNAAGRQPFGAPWSDGVVLSAKTGSITDRDGTAVRWLVGHVAHQNRSFVFVAAVTGPLETAANAAIDLAALKLRAARVL